MAEIDRIGGSLRGLPNEAIRGRKRELRRPVAVRETFDLDAISKGRLSPGAVGAILKSCDSIERCKVMMAAATGGYSATEEVARQALSSPDIEDRVVAVAALGMLGLAVDHSYLMRLAESVHLSQAAFLAASIRRFPPEVATDVGMTILERLEAESRSPRLGNESYDVHQAAFTNADLAIREAQWLDPCPHLGLRQVAEVLRRWNECLSGPRPTATVTRLRTGRETVVHVECGTGRIRLGLGASPYLDDRGRLQVANALVCLWIGGVEAWRLRVACGTCPFLLHSMDDERLRKISATFSASSPSQLIGGSDLDEILKELRSGSYTLLHLRLRLKRVDPKEPRLWFLLAFGIPDELYWVTLPPDGTDGLAIMVCPIQKRETLDESRVRSYGQRAPGDRGSVIAYACFDDRGRGGNAEISEAFVAVVLDGHHKLAAAVDAGEPADVLANLESSNHEAHRGEQVIDMLLKQCVVEP